MKNLQQQAASQTTARTDFTRRKKSLKQNARDFYTKATRSESVASSKSESTSNSNTAVRVGNNATTSKKGGSVGSNATGKVGSANAAPNTPSLRAIEVDAELERRKNGDAQAVEFLNQKTESGYITFAQKNEIISKLHLVAPNDVGKATTSLLPSQEEYYRYRAGDGRYDVSLSEDELKSKADVHRQIVSPASSKGVPTSTYRGTDFENLLSLPDKESVVFRYAVDGKGLTSKEADQVWEQLNTWREHRQNVLTGKADGDVPSYKGVSYDFLINRGGKEGISNAFGIQGISLTSKELEQVASEVALWEETRRNTKPRLDTDFDMLPIKLSVDDEGNVTVSPADGDAASLIFNEDSPFTDGEVIARAEGVLEKMDTEYSYETWHAAQTIQEDIDTLTAYYDYATTRANQYAHDAADADKAAMTKLANECQVKMMQLSVLYIMQAPYDNQEDYTIALQTAEDEARFPSMSLFELRDEYTRLKRQEKTAINDARLERLEEAITQKEDALLAEDYRSKMNADPNADAVVDETVNTFIHSKDGYVIMETDHTQVSLVAYNYVYGGGIGPNATPAGIETDEQYQMRLELSHLTKEEAKTYLYIYGMYGAEKAGAYYDALNLDERVYHAIDETAAENAQESIALSSIYSVLQKYAFSPIALANNISNVASGDGIDVYDYYNTQLRLGEAERDAASDKMREDYGAGASAGYDVMMEAADEIVTWPIKKYLGVTAALAVLGTHEAASAILNAKERGLDDGKAMAFGVVCGIADIVFHKLSQKMIANAKKAEDLVPAIKRELATRGIEASKELCSSIAVSVYDCVKNADRSQYDLRVAELIKQGYTKEEADTTAMNELFYQYCLSALKAGAIG